MATGKKMSEYTPFSKLNSEEKATYLSNAAVTTFGAKVSEGDKINVNIPLSTLVPSVPVTDVTVNGSSVVNNGVAAITVPTTSVPDPGTDMHRGHFLKVNNADDIVWSEVPVPELRGSDTVTYDASNSGALAVKYNTDTLDEDSTHGLTVKLPVPDTTDANEGDVLTVDSNGDIDWVAPSGGGGGGGLSPITPTPLTPTLADSIYHITIPSNNAYYTATLTGDGNVDIALPVLGANELYNIVLFINITYDFPDDRQILVPDAFNFYGLRSMDVATDNGWVYGAGFTQFIFLGHGYTMSTSAHSEA